jgi:phage gp36-like protein
MFATSSDMVARFGQREVIALTDRDLNGAIDDAVLQRALQDADAEISGYLAGRYAFPISPVPALLVGYACDIARYRLTGTDVTCTDDIESRYNKAIKYLTLVGRGDLSLGIDATGVTVGAAIESGPAVRVSAGRRLFHRSSLRDY